MSEAGRYRTISTRRFFDRASLDFALMRGTTEQISSSESEDTLYRHPEVLEAAVVAKPDEKWGETPCAFVTLRDGADDVTEADIIEFCRANLAHFKTPRTVVFGPLPKTSTGKIQKFKLRERV